MEIVCVNQTPDAQSGKRVAAPGFFAFPVQLLCDLSTVLRLPVEFLQPLDHLICSFEL